MKNRLDNPFDPEKKEAELQRESQSWDTSNIANAESADIPIIDVSAYFRNPCEQTLRALAGQLGQAVVQGESICSRP